MSTNIRKTKIAAALSIVGVLGAGSAAALVNTQILDSGPTDSGASAAVLPPASSIELTVPTTSGDTRVGEPDDSPSTTTAPSTTAVDAPAIAVTPAPSGMLTAFTVGDAGVVTVDVVEGRLLLVSAEPKSGWTVTKAEDDSTDDSDDVEDEVEVEFTSGRVRVEFEAELVDGRIVPKVESSSVGSEVAPSNTIPTDTAPTNTVPANTIDDDDHDDDDSYDDDSDDDGDDADDDDHDDDHDDDDADDVDDDRDDD